jgi:formylglycine-generating enzyme required for sulfatase activity
VKEFDGFSMALVPAGCFTMGSTEQEVDYALQLCEQQRGSGACQRDWYQDESPPGQICIHTPYWIDRYEVTNGDFGSTGYWLGNSRPREMVNWFEAVQFCESRSYGRLPTEAEWEFAARGPDHLVFPWGNTLISGNAIHGRSSGPTENIGSLPANMSWVGAFDMVGNVWEWVHTVYDETRFPYPYQINDGRENTLDAPRYVLRGGSWLDSAGDIRTANRDGADAAVHWQGFGFRCIRDFRAVDLN